MSGGQGQIEGAEVLQVLYGGVDLQDVDVVHDVTAHTAQLVKEPVTIPWCQVHQPVPCTCHQNIQVHVSTGIPWLSRMAKTLFENYHHTIYTMVRNYYQFDARLTNNHHHIIPRLESLNYPILRCRSQTYLQPLLPSGCSACWVHKGQRWPRPSDWTHHSSHSLHKTRYKEI